ncbi:MAG: toxin-antitoxin system HicB family antitoxin [Dermatophilaceae bacterium]|nr:type II toxin-antitoxin system HicB family antitoxin [Intrasporangiaceae bacterium]
MELSPYLRAIADDLEKVTALADESTRSVTGRLLTALEPSLQMALVQAVSDAVALVSAELDGVVAVVRMEGRDPVIAVEHTGESQAHQPPAEDEGDDSARVTVRLPQALKQRAEARAVESDQSLNTWIVQSIRRSTREDAFIPPFARPRVPGSRRVTGWA